KHISELEACVSSHPKARFTLTANTPLMKLLLELVFDGNRHVEILQESIYSPCLIDWAFDYIICIPMLGGKTDDVNSQFLTKETSFIAFENLLSHLKQNGVMQIAMPAKITFAGAGIAKLRKKITENYSLNSIAILPDGIFRPAISIKSYLLTVQNKKQGNVLIYNLKLDSDKLSAKVKGEILQENFIAFNDWRIELLLSKEDDNICRFNHSQTQKVKLKEVAEVFRGKSILKKTSSQGNIYILNISNIENSEIDYSSLEAIDEDRRKIKRYELNDGDIVLTCRGTAVKSALFKRQEKPVIASSNIVVIRVGEKVTSGYIFLFLQSPVGISLIKSFRRSTAVMNLNHTDIMEMEIPMLPLTVQKEISKDYEEEILKYNETIRTAGNRLSEIKNELYKKIL
ncbi:MAG: restriction endonuclease subunit S, partial [Oscillospiraceae bacterium]